MKTVAAKKFLVPLIGILLVAPFLALALVVGARVAVLSHGAQDDLLLMALALGGAAASIINGLGRRTMKVSRTSGNDSAETSKALSRRASMIHLGY